MGDLLGYVGADGFNLDECIGVSDKMLDSGLLWGKLLGQR